MYASGARDLLHVIFHQGLLVVVGQPQAVPDDDRQERLLGVGESQSVADNGTKFFACMAAS
jgi:hypothetical protein